MKLLLLLIGFCLLAYAPHLVVYAGKMRVKHYLATASLRKGAARLYEYKYTACMSLAIVFSLGGFILVVDQILSSF